MLHPSDKDLQLFVSAQLDDEKEKIIEKHLAQCPECSKRVSELERKPQDPLLQKVKAVAGADDDLSSHSIDQSNGDVSSQETVHAARPSRSDSSDDGFFTGGDVLGGNLRLEKKLGRGGMGEAWKASDLMAGRDVVVKLVPPEIRHAEAAMGQVRETFQKVHALQHQHICPMMSLNDDPTYGLYLVMKFIDGKTLDVYRRDYIEEHGRFPLAEILRILRDVARALDYSHERKVLHRDVKPQNIMVSPEDGVQLIDFGLAAEIRSSMLQLSETPMDIAGTRPYMAPEQWRGRLQDAKTDQYALAVTAYELIAGRQPFVGEDVSVLRECVLNEEPEPIPDIPDYINAVLAKALSKKRDDRFPDCKTFVRALNTNPIVPTENAESLMDAVPTLPPDAASRKSKRRTKIWTVILGMAVCAAFLGGLLGFLSNQSSQRPNGVVQSKTSKREKEPMADLSKLSDGEKRSLQRKYPELDWTDANVLVLPEPTEDALRQAFEKAAETTENDFIVVRTTEEKHRIVLNDGAFEIRYKTKDKGQVALLSLGPEKLVLDGNKKDRIFFIENWETNVDFAGIVFTNGFVIDSKGGGVEIRQASARFYHCDLIGNECKAVEKTEWYEGFGGAGISVVGALVLRNVLFEGNRIDNRDVAEGKKEYVGAAGLSANCSSFNATDVVFRNNIGGAMFANNFGTFRMHNISAVGNRALGGDIIHLRNDDGDRTIQVTNLFASGNTIFGENDYSGILLVRGKTQSRFLLNHLTIVDNFYDSDGGGVVIYDLGREDEIPTEVTLSNSIIAGNQRKGFGGDPSFGVRGKSEVGKLNIFNCITTDGPTEFAKERNNLVVSRKDLKLGEPKDFGNGVPVMSLLPGSPAIDAGTVTEHTPKTDITGRPRNVGKTPDIGAFEWQKNVGKPAMVDAWQPTEDELAAAPEDFKKYLKPIADRIEEKGGYVIAGRVFIDGKPPASIMDFDVRLNSFVGHRFADGWFYSGPYSASVSEHTKRIHAWGAQTEKLETPMVCDPTKINYVNIHLRTAEDDKLVYLTGRVVDEGGKPVENARVTAYCTTLHIPNTLEHVMTDRGGKYLFATKVFPHSWRVSVISPDGLTNRSTGETNPVEAGDIIIYHPRKVVIDSVFQPDGSEDFSKDNVITGRYELWTNRYSGAAKKNAKIGSGIVFDPTEKGHEMDIGLHLFPSGKLEFCHGNQNSTSHGHYSLGKTDFDSVKKAISGRIEKTRSKCEVGHVYVVRTYWKGYYAKFVVRSIDIMESR